MSSRMENLTHTHREREWHANTCTDRHAHRNERNSNLANWILVWSQVVTLWTEWWWNQQNQNRPTAIIRLVGFIS